NWNDTQSDSGGPPSGVIATGTGTLPMACCDPQATFDNFGNLFLTYLSDFGVAIAKSSDGGKSFTLAKLIVDANADQPSIAAGAGSVWVSYQDGKGRIVAAGAAVQGLGSVGTFSTPQVAPGTTGLSFGGIAVGPGGKVLVTYQNAASGNGPDTIKVSLDPDGLGAQGFGNPIVATGTNIGSNTPIQPQSNDLGVDAEA